MPGTSGMSSTAQGRFPSSPCRGVETATGPESSTTGSRGRQKCSEARFAISNRSVILAAINVSPSALRRRITCTARVLLAGCAGVSVLVLRASVAVTDPSALAVSFLKTVSSALAVSFSMTKVPASPILTLSSLRACSLMNVPRLNRCE